VAKVSVIIPARNEKYLTKTVDDLHENATGDVEIIAVLDGYWPDPKLSQHTNLVLIHKPKAEGMREAINSAAAIAKGKYLLKCDAHCSFGKGFDEILQADCDDDWVVIPRRYSLDAETWTLANERIRKPPIDYHYLAYPFRDMNDIGMHGEEWWPKIKHKTEPLIDDEMSSQGSCWFMHKKYFDGHLHGLSSEGYGSFYQEFQEIGMKTWLGGGQVKINKKTWYSHLHKNGKGYILGSNQRTQGTLYSFDFWFNDRWTERVHDFEWFINKFWPVPTWPDNWKEERNKYNASKR